MSAIGHKTNDNRSAIKAFTLVELILVMTILTVAVAIAAPSMSQFFRGRAQESEARRILSLIRYGQSRAVAEGVPVLLWVDIKEATYGLEQDTTYVDDDPKAVQCAVDSNLTIDTEINRAVVRKTSRSTGSLYVNIRGRNLPAIRFLSDGSFGSSSPAAISLSQGANSTIWIAQSHNGLTYEIQNQNSKVHNAFR